MGTETESTAGAKILVTGGARSGKSRYALARGEALAGPRLYVATAQAGDAEMAARIERHRAERGPGWQTAEEPLAPAGLVSAAPVVVLDCLTLWLSNLLHRPGAPAEGDDEEALIGFFRELAGAVAGTSGTVIAVTNEVGLGVVPASALARRFCDAAGRLAQIMAAVCDEVVLMCAGLPLRLK